MGRSTLLRPKLYAKRKQNYFSCSNATATAGAHRVAQTRCSAGASMRAPKVTQGRPSRAAIASASAAPMPAATTDVTSRPGRDNTCKAPSWIVRSWRSRHKLRPPATLRRWRMSASRPKPRANRARLSAMRFAAPVRRRMDDQRRRQDRRECAARRPSSRRRRAPGPAILRREVRASRRRQPAFGSILCRRARLFAAVRRRSDPAAGHTRRCRSSSSPCRSAATAAAGWRSGVRWREN